MKKFEDNLTRGFGKEKFEAFPKYEEIKKNQKMIEALLSEHA